MTEYTNIQKQPLPVITPKEVWFSKPIIVLYIIIFTLLIIIVGGWFKNNSNYTELENKIKQSDKKIDSLSILNKDLDKKVYYYEQHIFEIDNKLNNNNKKLNELKKDINEKVNDVDTYSYDRLYDEITGRYARYNQNDISN